MKLFLPHYNLQFGLLRCHKCTIILTLSQNLFIVFCGGQQDLKPHIFNTSNSWGLKELERIWFKFVEGGLDFLLLGDEVKQIQKLQQEGDMFEDE